MGDSGFNLYGKIKKFFKGKKEKAIVPPFIFLVFIVPIVIFGIYGFFYLRPFLNKEALLVYSTLIFFIITTNAFLGIFVIVNTRNRLQTEKQLTASTTELESKEEQIRIIFKNAPDAIIVIDSDGFVRQWNSKAEEIFGWMAHEVINRELYKFIIPEKYRKAHIIGLKKFMQTGEGPVINKTIEITGLHKSGTEFDVALSISSPVKFVNKFLFIGFIQDISQRKRNEEIIQKQNEALLRSNAELQQFAYVASHDLQEPLRMVTSFVQLLKHQYAHKLDDKAKEYIDFAVEGSARMGKLINDLLEFSRINILEPGNTVIDLNDVYKDVIKNLGVFIKEKNAVLIAEKLPSVRADFTQMVQLFQNLISNGIKFSENTKPLVKISFSSNDSEYTFKFKDNGIGIDPVYFKKIFVIFQRLHGKELYPGTGIGLAICKKIIESHGGRIWVESKPKEGSEFFFTLKK